MLSRDFSIIGAIRRRETVMQPLALIGAISFSIMASTAILAAPSQEQCAADWGRADKDVDGDLSGSEFTRYLIAIRKDGRHSEAGNDGKLTLDEFMAACKDGVFDNMEDRHR